MRQAGPHRASNDASSRQRVLDALRRAAVVCEVRRLSAETGLHPNTVRFHLARLQDQGLVSRRLLHSGQPGRPTVGYLPVADPDGADAERHFGQLADVLADVVSRTVGYLPVADPDGADAERHFGQLADVLADVVSRHVAGPEEVAVDAGRAWGARTVVLDDSRGPVAAIDATATLVARLGDVGFDPLVTVDEGRTVVLQRHCPFLEVAQRHQAVVCAVHLGYMQGVLQGLRAPITTERLVPFAGPDGCEAHLADLSPRVDVPRDALVPGDEGGVLRDSTQTGRTPG